MAEYPAASRPDVPLPALSAALRARYPGVVVKAFNSEGSQFIQFYAPRALLVEHGLMPPDGTFGDAIDEFGTRIMVGREYAFHVHLPDTGAVRGRVSTQHPDNAKTKALVSHLIARISKGGRNVARGS